MSKRRGEPKQESTQELRRRALLVAGFIAVGLVLVYFTFTTIVPAAIRVFTGEQTFAGEPTSYWTKALGGKNPKVKWPEAAKTLQRGGEKAVPVLSQILKSDDVQAKARAARTLVDIGSKEAIPALTAGQKDSDPHVRVWCAYGLALLAPEAGLAPVPAMLEVLLLDQKDQAIADSINKAIDQLPVEARVKGLVDATQHSTVEVRFIAVQRLGAMGPEAKAATPTLLLLLRERILDHEGYPMADRAATALAQVNPEARAAAVQAFMKELQDSTKDRAGAAYALGRFRGLAKPAVPILQKLLKDKDQNVSNEALKALQAIDPSIVDP